MQWRKGWDEGGKGGGGGGRRRSRKSRRRRRRRVVQRGESRVWRKRGLRRENVGRVAAEGRKEGGGEGQRQPRRAMSDPLSYSKLSGYLRRGNDGTCYRRRPLLQRPPPLCPCTCRASSSFSLSLSSPFSLPFFLYLPPLFIFPSFDYLPKFLSLFASLSLLLCLPPSPLLAFVFRENRGRKGERGKVGCLEEEEEDLMNFSRLLPFEPGIEYR